MNNPEFYIQKAEEIITRISKYKELKYSDDLKYSLRDLELDTELLFFGYSENYPALLDLKQMKERYNQKEFDFEDVIINKLLSVLSSFKSFILDQFPLYRMKLDLETRLSDH
ncbi:MAG: hypothetical protein JXR82_02635 [Marinifilaceae bacterium]|nr:hypothetical protein [Marinifilaceae bacterium]